MALQPSVGFWPLFSFLILYTVCRTPWEGDEPVARPQPTHRTAQTQNMRTETSIPRVGFEPTTPAFERAKTIHVLDRAASVIGRNISYFEENILQIRQISITVWYVWNSLRNYSKHCAWRNCSSHVSTWEVLSTCFHCYRWPTIPESMFCCVFNWTESQSTSYYPFYLVTFHPTVKAVLLVIFFLFSL
jgi:hypothetical protein